jgi:hypothetical protein
MIAMSCRHRSQDSKLVSEVTVSVSVDTQFNTVRVVITMVIRTRKRKQPKCNRPKHLYVSDITVHEVTTAERFFQILNDLHRFH